MLSINKKGNFQCFLTIGPKDARLKTRAALATSFKIDLASLVDFQLITSFEKTHTGRQKLISISQIRDFKKQIFEKPVKHSHRLVVIEDAHNLTHLAQNALLKILEEPPKHAVIILEADKTSSILPTIISRLLVINTSSKKTPQAQKESFLNRDLKANLEQIADINSPIIWLNEQMITTYNLLINKLKKRESNISFDQITSSLRQLAQARQMIDANVNSRFVLVQLMLSHDLKQNL